MGAAEMKAGHTEEYVDGTSAAPWPQLDGVRPNTSPSLVDDGRSEDGEGRGGAKYNSSTTKIFLLDAKLQRIYSYKLTERYLTIHGGKCLTYE